MSASLAERDELVPGISPDLYGRAEFEAIAGLVHKEAGIILPPGKAMLVYSRLAPFVRRTGSETFARYFALMESDADERAAAVAALTTNHTFFYREAHHFEHFGEQVRPGLLTRLAGNEPVRLWSAGCSSGEETWSLVLTLLGPDKLEGRRTASKDLVVLASDLAPKALEKARAATYPEADLAPVPADLQEAWTTRSGGEAAIAPAARDLVRFRLLNLQGDWPLRRKFDVIFCRNVMIYFDNPTKERLVARFAEQLRPGGYLYIGHSERVTGPAAECLQAVGPTIYRKDAA